MGVFGLIVIPDLSQYFMELCIEILKLGLHEWIEIITIKIGFGSLNKCSIIPIETVCAT